MQISFYIICLPVCLLPTCHASSLPSLIYLSVHYLNLCSSLSCHLYSDASILSKFTSVIYPLLSKTISFVSFHLTRYINLLAMPICMPIPPANAKHILHAFAQCQSLGRPSMCLGLLEADDQISVCNHSTHLPAVQFYLWSQSHERSLLEESSWEPHWQ